MPYRRSEKAIPLALALGAYVLALLQKPGWASSDTKIDLHVDPGRFLGDVASVWSPTVGLGHIQGGQYGGYLWPMGPFFALGHAIGLSPWVVQRLWLGTILALGAWGVVRLLDALRGRPRGAAHVIAAVLFAANPYVVVFANRASFTLLAYAALPWLLLCVHRGLRRPRRWWWAAAFALILTSTGPGVNAAVWAWLLPGPVLLLLYERFVNHVPIRAFSLRLGVASAAASVWWVVPLVVQSAYGVNFLQYTEQVGSIWGPTSLPEVLRLMGYWPSYLGVGYGDQLAPYFGSSPTMLFDLPTVVASLVIPGLALAGFAWTRRWRYGPFFVALALLGVLAMSVGFPPGTPLRRAAVFAYDNVQALQFLRTTNKAGPLVALGIACLGGVAGAELLRRVMRRRALMAGAAALGALLVVLAALPLFKGDAVGLTWKRIPAAWKNVAHDLDRGLPANTRAAVLPGQEFAFYRWGGTVDPILPSLTERPVAIRNEPPYDDVHAIDAFWTVDGMVQQRRLIPGQLNPLLDLLNVGAVVTGTDDDPNRSGGMPPADAARELAAQGYRTPARAYGPVSTFPSGADSVAPPPRLPEVRRYDRPAPPGIVRVEPAGRATVVDGSAPGLADLAALGTLPRDAALRYAGDVSAAEIKAAAAAGDPIVITDSNRRRAFVASRARQTFGWTVAASEKLPPDAATLDPFTARGSDAQTVAVYRGARSVTAPYTPQQAMFPEHRPYAAFDGDPRTSWLADPLLEDARHWVEVGLLHPRDIPYLDVLPDSSNPLYTVTRVDVNGKQFDVHPGWNRLAVRLKGATAVRMTIVGHRSEGPNAGGAGGFDEIRVPGLHVREMLRPPVLAERALAGANLQRTPLSYVFERTTGDDPFQRSPVPPPPPGSGNSTEAEAALVRRAQDAETGIDRLITPPRDGAWRAGGWATIAPAAPDPALDRLAGASLHGASFSSSARFDGTPGHRASSAFDGDPQTAWIAPWYGRSAWIAWRTPRPRTITRLTLRPAGRVALPSTVRVSSGGRSTPGLPVRDGAVDLPQPMRGRAFRVAVVRAPSGAAVGISELSGRGVPHAQVPRSGAIRARCGMLAGTVAGMPLKLQPQGGVAALDAGRPLRTRGCGAPLQLPAGSTEVRVPGGLLRPLVLGLDSPAPSGAPASTPEAAGGGRVIDPGTSGRGSHDDVKVDVNGPSWLVLGESFNRGWQADCDGRSLGAPQVVDGFANGWRVNRGCHDVSFTFGPQRLVTAGYMVGGVLCLALALLLLLHRRLRSADTPQPLLGDDRAWRLPLRRALAAGVVAAVVFGFAFALRAGVLIGPAVALILWRGVSTRVLAIGAGVLLAVVVPLLYVLFPGDDRGGYDTRYAIEHLGAHWVAVAAFVLLVLALAQTLAAARRKPRVRA